MKTGKINHDPGPLPQSATYCRHCNMAFPVAVPIIGAPHDTGFVQLTAQLADHIQRKHPEQLQKDLAAQVQLSIGCSAQIVLANFDSTDQGLMEWRDRERHKIFRAMMRSGVSDEKIEQKVRALFEMYAHSPEEGPTEEDVIAVFKSMRDAIEERNLYPEPSKTRPTVGYSPTPHFGRLPHYRG